jgi:hypothetical protein
MQNRAYSIYSFVDLVDLEGTMSMDNKNLTPDGLGNAISRRRLVAGLTGATAMAAGYATLPHQAMAGRRQWTMAARSGLRPERMMAQDASPAVAAEGQVGRFHGIMVGVGAPPTEGGRCPVLTANFEAPGLATHLGRFTTSQNHCMDPDGADPLAFTNGEYTFTGEDGSSISGRYSGRLLPTETTDVDNLFLIQGRFTIESGTGRLEGATGGGPADGIMNMTTGEMSLYLGGAIAYPGLGVGVEGLPDALPLKTKAW